MHFEFRLEIRLHKKGSESNFGPFLNFHRMFQKFLISARRQFLINDIRKAIQS